MRNVFVSKPNALRLDQQRFWAKFNARLEQRSLRPRSVGEFDYLNVAPMGAVRRTMAECQGAIILGLRQINVLDAVLKEGTIQESRSMPSNFLPTPWNQIEAGMAFMLGLPTLIIKEDGV
jgi:hypothetical protein